MPNNALLSQLSGHRAVLLGCEAIGWLHMAGKAHPDFLRQHGGQKIGYKPKKWDKGLVPDWDSALGWLAKIDAITWPRYLSDFLRQYDKGRSESSAVGLLQAAHAMASGIEKNHPSNTKKYLGQDATHMWLTTAFGHPVRNLLEDPPDVLRDGGWETLLSEIAKLLCDLHKLAVPIAPHTESSVQSWWDWREAAIGSDGWLRQAFSQTLAETRIPNNEVTLWDQSYVAAALFKSAVAGALLAGSRFDWKQNLKQSTRWRVLTVGLGVGYYEARAVRIGDWTGARREIDRFFDAVCKLVEVELAVGSLLYRDDDLLAFSFPGLRAGKGDPEGVREPLRKEVQERVDRLAERIDTPPVLRLSESTRSMIRMAREVEKARKTLRVPLHRRWRVPANEKAKGGHICPVCGLRRNGDKSSSREKKGKPCEPCAERRRGRLQDWLAGRVGGDSIWISEVADRHDRVALLTLRLDITGWLDGTAVDSLRAQSLPDMLEANPGLRGYVSTESRQPHWETLTNAIAGYVSSPQKDTGGKRSDPLLSSLNDGFRHETDLGAFFDKMVQDRADAPSWAELKGHDARRAEWLAHQLFRKNASPGRVRRFWETTETFFSELLVQFREIVSRSSNRWRVRRLIFTAKGGEEWKDKETYQGHSGVGDDAAPLELVYREGSKDFVTTCNLARVLGPADDPGVLRGKDLEVVDDEGERHALLVEQVDEAFAPLGTYHPLIVLARSPRCFRLLVPLEAADTCVQTAVKKWQTEFARVWDRLPLRVGIVAFPRKLPYQAVVEAARNVENDLDRCEQETWRVHDVHTLDGVTVLSLVRPDEEHQLVTVPVALPDGRPDVFYPYCAVDAPQLRQPHDFAAPTWDRETGRHGTQVYRWMPELRPGDRIRVAPSRVARVFLDSTARRFEPVPVRYLDDWCAAREVWRLVLQAAPSLTAVRALEAILVEKREAWSSRDDAIDQESWLAFVRASIVNLWGVRGEALETLVAATRRGILQEALAWHLHVLKQDMEGE